MLRRQARNHWRILKNNIHEVIGKIQVQVIDNVLKNWTERIGYGMVSRGIEFKCNYFPLLTERIVLSKKKEIEKVLSSFF